MWGNNIQKLEMFFAVNLAFLDHLEDLPEVLDTPIDRMLCNSVLALCQN